MGSVLFVKANPKIKNSHSERRVDVITKNVEEFVCILHCKRSQTSQTEMLKKVEFFHSQPKIIDKSQLFPSVWLCTFVASSDSTVLAIQCWCQSVLGGVVLFFCHQRAIISTHSPSCLPPLEDSLQATSW